MKPLIYITEDDENIRELVKLSLSSYGYDAQVFECAEDFFVAFRAKAPDLAIFDITLPGMDGINALKSIRETNAELPVILLTAKDSELDKIRGLDTGADDYITKPFSIMELMARVRSLLRRTTIKPEKELMTLGIISLNLKTREVLVDNKAIVLTFKEFELLKYLMENHTKVVSRNEILDKVWGYEYLGETRTIDIHIRTLRQKLGTAGEMITTCRGLGYRLQERTENG